MTLELTLDLNSPPMMHPMYVCVCLHGHFNFLKFFVQSEITVGMIELIAEKPICYLKLSKRPLCYFY